MPIAVELREHRGVPGVEAITLENKVWSGSRRFLFRHEAIAWAVALRRSWGRRGVGYFETMIETWL
jgi:hypothetical protein